jgi:hypothetical protein
MVVAGLSIGALVGVVLSAGFVYWEVGRYAEPQVPVTRFDERREIFAYTAGLFVGVPLAVSYVLFLVELEFGSLFGSLLLLAGLVVGTEASQLLLVRSRYWAGAARPFYVLGFRAAVGGILALAIVASYLDSPTVDALGVTRALVSAAAVVALEVAGSLLSYRGEAPFDRPGGGPWIGGAVGATGFFMLGIGALAGGLTALAAAAVVLAGASAVYARLRPLLDRVSPPILPSGSEPSESPLPYGRTEPSTPEGIGSARR